MNEKIERWAKILVDYSSNVQKGELVYLEANSVESKPLYDAVRKRIVQKGAYPSDHFCYDPFGLSSVGYKDYAFLRYASQEQLELRNIFPFFKIKLKEVKAMDAVIIIVADADPKELSKISSEKIITLAKTLNPIFQERLRKKWVATTYPTSAFARQAGMSTVEFEEFVYKALFVDKKNPVREWKEFSKHQKTLVDILNKGKKVRIISNNMNLTMSIKGRTAESDDGHVNLPGGEVYTGPVENSVNGTIFFGDFPAIYLGKEVRGIRLEFKDGKVIKASAEKNDKFLQTILNTDKGSRYLGELGIGTNFKIQRFVNEIGFDEKIGGTFHLALGDGFEECGGKNHSAVHWDILKDLRKEGAIYIDGLRLIVNKDYIGLA